MAQNRVRIVDVADSLGLITATVSKVILMFFCEADYEKLRNQMRISFVVYDGYFEKCSKVVNMVILEYQIWQHIYLNGVLWGGIRCLPRKKYSGLLYR